MRMDAVNVSGHGVVQAFGARTSLKWWVSCAQVADHACACECPRLQAAHKATGSEENENAAFAAFAHTSHTQGPFPADTTMHSGVNSFGSLFNELPSTSRPGAAVDPVIEV